MFLGPSIAIPSHLYGYHCIMECHSHLYIGQIQSIITSFKMMLIKISLAMMMLSGMTTMGERIAIQLGFRTPGGYGSQNLLAPLAEPKTPKECEALCLAKVRDNARSHQRDTG